MSDDIDRLERDVGRHREDLDRALGRLAEGSTWESIGEEAAIMADRTSMGPAVRETLSRLGEHPLAVALIGAGVGMLLVSAYSRTRAEASRDETSRDEASNKPAPTPGPGPDPAPRATAPEWARATAGATPAPAAPVFTRPGTGQPPLRAGSDRGPVAREMPAPVASSDSTVFKGDRPS